MVVEAQRGGLVPSEPEPAAPLEPSVLDACYGCSASTTDTETTEQPASRQ